MNASTVADVLLIVAAVVWVLARQVQVARVKPRLLVLAPLVLAFFGIRSLPASTWRVPADLALLAVSAALSLGLIPGAEYVNVPATGHMVAGDDNDVFTRRVNGFLAGLAASS